MDTSEQYIKMRKMAIPNLGMGIPPGPSGTFLDGVMYVWVDNKGDWYYFTETEAFQLERQDQLQAMAGYRDHENSYALLKTFERWVTGECLEDARKTQWSMEQLWFAFVMKENYRKLWNGEDWMKEGE